MKAYSFDRPQAVIVERKENGLCDVLIAANVVEETRPDFEDSSIIYTTYHYDFYRFELGWRSSLLEEITQNLPLWIQYAKEQEKKPDELSAKEKIEHLIEENELLRGCVMELANVVFA